MRRLERELVAFLDLSEETGIVFVLLPGRSTFYMGSQTTNPNFVNYWPNAKDDETLLRETIQPFLRRSWASCRLGTRYLVF